MHALLAETYIRHRHTSAYSTAEFWLGSVRRLARRNRRTDSISSTRENAAHHVVSVGKVFTFCWRMRWDDFIYSERDLAAEVRFI